MFILRDLVVVKTKIKYLRISLGSCLLATRESKTLTCVKSISARKLEQRWYRGNYFVLNFKDDFFIIKE